MKKALMASLFSLLIFSGCQEKNNTKTYAIRDFRAPLRPYLTEIVSKGVVGGSDSATSYIEIHATDEELKRLGNSEHPVLRAVAFRIMMERPSIDHFQLIMNNLDDTAIVATDVGEFGIRYFMVSDDLLQNGKWKDTIARNQTLDRIILKHNYLSCAFTSLLKVEPLGKYYGAIKDMALRRRNYDKEVGEMAFDDREYALFALARYKKQEDIDTIRNILIEEVWRMGGPSFWLMEEFPHESYLDVFEAYYPRYFYRQICRERNNYIPESFIATVASYKNERSAAILGQILNRNPFVSCDVQTYFLKNKLAYAIWDNPCSAYSKLRKQVEGQIRKYESQRIELPLIEPYQGHIDKPDPEPEPIRW